jgi:phosphoglycerol transferase MdoB-like AlkP superfamily enzyme
LLSNVLQHLEAVKPYAFMPSEQARALTQSLYAPSPQEGSMFLTTTRPNVMLVVFEGWSADVVEGLGGMEGMAPRLSGLIREGLSFDSCYASGNLSDQGMGAVFSAYPAQPRTSIVTIPSKYPSLPALPATFRKAGYASSFVFGGQLMYGNIRSYMYHCGFDRIEEEADFPESVYRGRLGVHDGDLYRRQLQVMDALKPPFFSAVFTQSTHGPYDIPGKRQNPFEGQHADYLQSLQYADSALGAFMDAARSRPWFSNTLFVFVSDHHHDTPRGYSYHSPQYRRIPLVFYGPVLKPEFRGRQEHRICSQLDLAATLLAQCAMDASEYQWSRNLMQPGTPESACYTFDEGVGIKVPNAQVVWWQNEQRMGFDIAARKSQRDSLLRVAKAFLQRLTEDFDAR